MLRPSRPALRRVVWAVLLALTAPAATLTAGPAAAGPAAGPTAGPATAASGSRVPGKPCQERWVSAWGFSPSDARGLTQPLVAQTLRQIATPSLGGRELRLRLTNRYSREPVTFGAVTIAKQAVGAGIVASSLRTVTFGGRRSLTLAAGQERLSDPVRLKFPRFAKLAVSTYVANAVQAPTHHATAAQTSYQTPPGAGDATRAVTAKAFPLSTPAPVVGLPANMFYLSGLEVRATGRASSVVAFGDSLTDGTQGGPVPLISDPGIVDRDTRWPDRLARRLASAGLPLAVINAGIAGNQLLSDATVPYFGPAGLTRVTADVLELHGVTDVVVLEGINDIGQGQATAAALASGYRRIIGLLERRGLAVHVGTLTPQSTTNRPGYGARAEPTRLAVNRWIRRQRLSASVIDFDRAVRDPEDPSRIRPAYDGGDGLHMSPAGYQAMADAVPLSALRGSRCRR